VDGFELRPRTPAQQKVYPNPLAQEHLMGCIVLARFTHTHKSHKELSTLIRLNYYYSEKVPPTVSIPLVRQREQAG
jgi:hypothetical protein